MNKLRSILLIIGAVGMYACTTVESGVVTTESRSATRHTAATVPGETGAVSGKEHSVSRAIQYEVSGGFAGIRRQLNVSGNGHIIASDLKRKRSVEQQATPDQLVKIADALSKIDPSRLSAKGPKTSNHCADCFQHALTVDNAGQHYKLDVDDIMMQDPACAELIVLLSSLLDQVLAKQAP
jgi:hypothetical protein